MTQLPPLTNFACGAMLHRVLPSGGCGDVGDVDDAFCKLLAPAGSDSGAHLRLRTLRILRR